MYTVYIHGILELGCGSPDKILSDLTIKTNFAMKNGMQSYKMDKVESKSVCMGTTMWGMFTNQ